jgi:hypothetical protein
MRLLASRDARLHRERVFVSTLAIASAVSVAVLVVLESRAPASVEEPACTAWLAMEDADENL